MHKRRTTQQVKEIDNFIMENYPIHGADFCAQALREPLAYIKGRIKVGKVGKLKKMQSAHDMEQRIEYIIGLNRELRLENMMLIAERMEVENG